MSGNAAFREAEIALELAGALLNSTVGEASLVRRERLAERLDALMQRDRAYQTPGMALQLAACG
ncbi:MAG: hypothetical protein ACI9EF_001726 [Pseudohongiellaceae bacterium]|jgi:hypothetical protein